MLRFYAESVVAALNELQEIDHFMRRDPEWFFTEGNLQGCLDKIDALIAELVKLHLNVTLRKVRDARHYLETAPQQPKERWEARGNLLSDWFEDIRERLEDELEGKVLFSVTTHPEYLEPPTPLFGEDFASKYLTDGVYELDEAAKCYALQRSTASVFHLMRIMEVGIRAIARCLGLPDPIKDAERNWAIVLKKINDEMVARNKDTPPRWANPKDKDWFALAYASLDSVRAAWRNPTMHVEKKYTDSEAELIFIAVRGFMRAVAERMDEEGNPHA